MDFIMNQFSQIYYPNLDPYQQQYNTPSSVNLDNIRINQMSIILYTLEDYMSKGNTSNDPDLPKEIDNIFEELEGTIDKHYDKIEAAKKKQPKAEW